MIQKFTKYKTVLGMVKNISDDKKFIKDFENKIKENIVYVVYDDILESPIVIFHELKDAKRYVENRMGERLKWNSNNLKGVWCSNSFIIERKKVV